MIDPESEPVDNLELIRRMHRPTTPTPDQFGRMTPGSEVVLATLSRVRLRPGVFFVNDNGVQPYREPNYKPRQRKRLRKDLFPPEEEVGVIRKTTG